MLKEFPFRISFVFEQAVDTGGVCRDLYSAFWDIAYVKHFDGERLLVPAVNPNTELLILPVLGKILVHGFMVCSFLPVRLAFPVIAAILCGPNVELSNDVYLESLLDFMSTHDSSLIREALKEEKFSSSLTCILLTILSRLDCTQVPTPVNMKQLLIRGVGSKL